MSKSTLSSPHIAALEPYMSARRIGGQGEVWLNANESPFQRASSTLDASQYHRYPDEGPDLVQAAYADYVGLQAAQVLALRGADEAIDLLIRAYCKAGEDSILVSSPTYGMYEVCANIQNAGVIDVPLRADFQLDVAAICACEAAKLIFICHPNNPTGAPFAQQDLVTIIEHFSGKALVVVDEAYIEFCPEKSLVPLLAAHEHLVVVRTMSKAFGLAGVHVGYLLSNEAIMSTMRKVSAPYPLADPCAQIALASLSHQGIALMKKQVAAIESIRDAFVQSIEDLPCVDQTWASATNFSMVAFKDVDRTWQALTDAGIVARQIPQSRLSSVIRFSIGSKQEMALVVSVLRTL